MKKNLILIPALALVLAACTQPAKKPDGAAVEDQGVTGAQTSGVDQQGVQGEALDGADGAAKGALPADAGRRVLFGYDSSTVDGENRAIVEANARYMSANPNVRVTLEGHTDERGTREYNLALGERRAQSVERMLRVLGVSSNRITTVSYGEEKPANPGQGEEAWAANRRVEFVYK